MFASIARALGIIFDPAFRRLVLKAAGLTLAMFIAGVVGLEALLAVLPLPVFAARLLEVLAPVLMRVLLSTLGPSVAAFIASLFLDQMAERIEARDYPRTPPALAGSGRRTLKAGLRLTGLVVGADIVLLPFDLGLPGLGWLLMLAVNGWLLGREYFELAALRHMAFNETVVLRKIHGRKITLAGLLIALFSAIPGLDLIAPLFGTALMVHLLRQIQDHP